ncbi:hypothetical protein ACIBQ6_21955 [Nonomuraea sp. NPDC049655]|uniref:hypothetical protein n=1 Tax=Nonomuraea sp. NPDC049655 TaxID=3364355 RepID=UPI003789BCE0
MSDEEHAGCRVCGRTDVGLKKDGTLRQHVHAAYKGSGFLRPGGSRCDGVGHPPKGVLGRYALAVIEALRVEFPDLEQPVTAQVIGEAVQQYRAAPTPSSGFECLLTGHGSWRLRPHMEIPGLVRVACWQPNPSDVAREREELLNARLNEIR